VFSISPSVFLLRKNPPPSSDGGKGLYNNYELRITNYALGVSPTNYNLQFLKAPQPTVITNLILTGGCGMIFIKI